MTQTMLNNGTVDSALFSSETASADRGPLAQFVLAPAVRRPFAAEESLVADSRSALTPAQMVERKLVHLLRDTPLPLSQRLSKPRR